MEWEDSSFWDWRSFSRRHSGQRQRVASGEAGTGGQSAHQQSPCGEQLIGALHWTQRVIMPPIIAFRGRGDNGFQDPFFAPGGFEVPGFWYLLSKTIWPCHNHRGVGRQHRNHVELHAWVRAGVRCSSCRNCFRRRPSSRRRVWGTSRNSEWNGRRGADLRRR